MLPTLSNNALVIATSPAERIALAEHAVTQDRDEVARLRTLADLGDTYSADLLAGALEALEASEQTLATLRAEVIA